MAQGLCNVNTLEERTGEGCRLNIVKYTMYRICCVLICLFQITECYRNVLIHVIVAALCFEKREKNY